VGRRPGEDDRPCSGIKVAEELEAVEFLEIDDLSDYLDDSMVRSSSLGSRHDLDWTTVGAAPSEGHQPSPGDMDGVEPMADFSGPGLALGGEAPGSRLSASALAALAASAPSPGGDAGATAGSPWSGGPCVLGSYEIDDLSDYEDNGHARASSLCEVEHRDWATLVCAAEWRCMGSASEGAVVGTVSAVNAS